MLLVESTRVLPYTYTHYCHTCHSCHTLKLRARVSLLITEFPFHVAIDSLAARIVKPRGTQGEYPDTGARTVRVLLALGSRSPARGRPKSTPTAAVVSVGPVAVMMLCDDAHEVV